MSGDPEPDDPCPTCGYALIDLCGRCHRPFNGGSHEACAMTPSEFFSDPECPEARR